MRSEWIPHHQDRYCHFMEDSQQRRERVHLMCTVGRWVQHCIFHRNYERATIPSSREIVRTKTFPQWIFDCQLYFDSHHFPSNHEIKSERDICPVPSLTEFIVHKIGFNGPFGRDHFAFFHKSLETPIKLNKAPLKSTTISSSSSSFPPFEPSQDLVCCFCRLPKLAYHHTHRL